jgi:hypothetical protein
MLVMKNLCLILYIGLCLVYFPACSPVDLSIDIWYGKKQSFGHPGNPQRAINILGNVGYEKNLNSLQYSLNKGEWMNLSIGRNDTRLARQGDFNIEILRSALREGNNRIQIRAEDNKNRSIRSTVKVQYTSQKSWSLPYEIHWDQVKNLQKAVCITDGKWKQVPGGIRTMEPYYDRILAVGDSTWTDFQMEISVIFHAYTLPEPGPPTYNVSHAALAMRWPGHDDDGKQPRIKWYPLGATCEMQLKPDLDSCRWRILGGASLKTENSSRLKQIVLDKKYRMKSRVESLENDSTRYAVKFWQHGKPEPPEWDLVSHEGPEDEQYGSGLFLSHNTDVTFGDLKVTPL